MKNLEELQKHLVNAHCAWMLFCNIENELSHAIKSKLPKHIQNKIGSIGFETECVDYMILCVRVASENANEVYASLTTAYPSINWSIYDMGNFSSIDLKLDDDVIESLHISVYESLI